MNSLVKKTFYMCMLLLLVSADAIASNSSDAQFTAAIGTANTVFEGLRNLSYVLAGFGLVAFAASAIFGKISFKWLVMICSGLFILATAENIEAYVKDNQASGSGSGPAALTNTSTDYGTPPCDSIGDPEDDTVQQMYKDGGCTY